MPFIRLRGPLSDDQTARVLHVLLAGLAAWLAVGFLATIPFAPQSFPRYFNPLVQETSYVTALVLLRLGHFRRASLAYLIGTWVWATLICFSAGSIRGGGALLYVSLPASAAWLLGCRAAIRMAGACLLSGLVFAVLEMTHETLPLQKATPLGIWFVIVQAVVINAIPVGQIIGRLQDLASDLERSRDEIRALAGSLMKAQEDERRRLSRELHDQICHQLGYLASDIGNLADSPLPPVNLRAELTAIRARVVKTSQDTHDIAYQMHTSILKDLGLVASLKALCRQFSDQHPKIAVDFENAGPPAPIPSEVATCIYRVAQEGLQNTAKHSGAKNVSVRLAFNKRDAVLTIQDNGAGFDPKAVKGLGGIGLISMKERAYSVKGKLTITAKPGHGAQITMEIPLFEIAKSSKLDTAVRLDA
jgi:signal transduction histidine kinase